MRRLSQLREARRLATEVAQGTLERGARTIACLAVAEIAWCHLASGQLDEAEAEALRADALMGDASQHAREPATLLAAVAMSRGWPEEARARIADHARLRKVEAHLG